MPNQLETLRFHNPTAFSGMTGVVDKQNAIIFGVSLITSGLEAEGHSLFVDKTTVTQLHAMASEMQKVPVTQNHEGGIEDVNGYITNVRMDGDKLRGDWHLLHTHEETPTMLERAERQPTTFGLSLAFKGDPKGVLHNGRQCARAEKLLSADVVKRPAANPGGLFSAKDSVDTKTKVMADQTNTQQNQEPTLADVIALIQQQNARIEEMAGIQSQIVDHINGQGADNSRISREELEQLNAATDEQLAQVGLTREEVNAAVEQFNAQLVADQQNGDDQGDDQGQAYEGQGQAAGGELAGAGAGAGAGAAAGGTAQFQALQNELIQLRRKVEAKEKREIELADASLANEVNAKIEALALQRDQLLEFSERAVAQIEALELHVRTGTRPVKAGVDNGIRLFGANGNGELHPYQKKLKEIELSRKCTPGQAIQFADAEDNGALHADWLATMSQKTIRA